MRGCDIAEKLLVRDGGFDRSINWLELDCEKNLLQNVKFIFGY